MLSCLGSRQFSLFAARRLDGISHGSRRVGTGGKRRVDANLIIYAFVAVALVVLVARIVISVRKGTFTSTKPTATPETFSDHSTGSGDG